MTGRTSAVPFELPGLWHVHTDRTDGVNTVSELLEFAVASDFPLVAITEHVRRELTYDFDALYDEAKALADELEIRCLVGCEAKVLDAAGRLDAMPATLDRADVVYAAYHGTPFTNESYLESITAMLANPAVDVWAHPFTYLAEHDFDIDPDALESVLDALRRTGVRFELNLRRPTDVVQWADLRDVRTVVGYDLHDIAHWRDPSSVPAILGGS